MYGLQHWNNSYLKTMLIVAICNIKNSIYLVCDELNKPVATFQTRIIDSSIEFQKLAVIPNFKGKGIGSFCLCKLEEMARIDNCNRLICEVYDKSEHAIQFYYRKGFSEYGVTETLKYREIKMEKYI